MSSFHLTSGFTAHGQPAQRSPLQSMYEKNLHCRGHVFKENSQKKRVVPFPSLSISSEQLPKTTLHTLGLRLSVTREAVILFPGQVLVSYRTS